MNMPFENDFPPMDPPMDMPPPMGPPPMGPPPMGPPPGYPPPEEVKMANDNLSYSSIYGYKRAIDLVVCLLEMKVEQLKNENKIINNAIDLYIQNNFRALYNPENFAIAEFPSYLSGYVDAALKNMDMETIDMSFASSNSRVVITPKENADKLQELRRKVIQYAKDFSLNKEKLNELKKSNEEVLTTPVGYFNESNSASFFSLLTHLSDQKVVYTVNAEDKTISFLSRDREKVKRAIGKVAAELASEDKEYKEKVFNEKNRTIGQIKEKIELLPENEYIYISSADNIFSNSSNFLKISKDSISLIQENGLIDREKISIPFKDNYDNLILAISSFKNPVTLSNEEFDRLDKREIVLEKDREKYGIQKENEKDKNLIDFLSKSSRFNWVRETKEGNYNEKNWEYIKEKMEQEVAKPIQEQDKQLVSAWNKVKDYTYEDYSIVLDRYRNANMFLNNAFNMALSDKEIERDREREERERGED